MPAPHPVQNAIQALIRHLEERKDYSETVWLTPKARKTLAKLPGIYEAISAQAPAAAVVEAPRPAPVREPAPAPVRTVVQEQPAPTRQAPEFREAPPRREEHSAPPWETREFQPRPERQPEPAPMARQESPAKPAKPTLVPQGNTKAEKLAWLRERILDWPPLKQIDTLRPTMVFAVGNPDAEIVFVGEAPGGEEERRKEPFVGPAGELLDKIIGAMGLKRQDIYISNIVKYRPAVPNQGETNRKPTADEMAACIDFVLAEIEIIQPKVVVALGATAAEGLLGLTQSLASSRNRFYPLKNFQVMVTYHPSYLLRNQALSERRKVWEDMMKVMDKAGLPISEKQRGYFLK